MFFNNIRLYLDNPNTGRLKIKYVCKKCGKEMDEAENYRIPVRCNVPDYHLAEFICTNCKKFDL